MRLLRTSAPAGDAALIEYAAKFGHAELTDVRSQQAEIEEAFAELESIDPRVRHDAEDGRQEHPPLP